VHGGARQDVRQRGVSYAAGGRAGGLKRSVRGRFRFCSLRYKGMKTRTGRAVVSRWPQSTTSPVIRPKAMRDISELGAKDIEGTLYSVRTTPKIPCLCSLGDC
jgi:hypothetical protein